VKRRLSALLLLSLYLTGCTTWRPVTVSPRQLIEDEQPGLIRIVQADGTQLELRNPRLERDSVTAVFSVRLSSGRFVTDTARIALTDVTAVETKRLSIIRTAALTVVAVPVLFVAVLVTACADPDDCWALRTR
jgi:hypothetical protein